MKPKVFLVHGWSVRTTQTYQALHLKLAESGFEAKDIYLGRYVSLENEIEIRDISKAMHEALKKELNSVWTEPFHIITHSTGALVVKHWIVNHYTGKYAQNKSLRNVVFLAAPHFGSRLAHHGRSMLAEVMEFGETGKKVLNSLELGSDFSWEINEKLLNSATWRDKGIRFYSLIGDRVKKHLFKSKIFPAAFEEGSDMVVRAAAGNLNFKRFRLDGRTGKFTKINEMKGLAYAALHRYTHSNEDFGIMNSIIKKSSPANHQALGLTLKCLKVNTENEYKTISKELEAATAETRKVKQGFAQLDFRFIDEEGQPVTDFVFKLGAVVNGVRKPSKTVAHTHKNRITPNHFTVFVNLKELEPHLVYFIDINTDSDSSLYNFYPDPLTITAKANTITEIITEDQTTQIEVVLSREPSENLFVFHKGNDSDMHVSWNRDGQINKTRLPTK